MEQHMVKCFRTTTGDEVLAEIISEDDQKIVFKNPIAMILTPTREIAGMPWLQLAATQTQEFTVAKTHILIIYTPNRDVIDNYRQQTGGIITAPASALNQLQIP